MNMDFPSKEIMDSVIEQNIGKMFGSLESASIEHFLQTGSINGSFRERLHDTIKDCFHMMRIKELTIKTNEK